jgi:prepilin-type N-terminal cleavage/methylation domain-containing protein
MTPLSRRSPRRRRGRQRGFTLVELIVALALTASLVVVLFSAIGLGFRGMARVEANASVLERRQQIDYLLRRQLAATYPASDVFATESPLTGSAQAMTFYALDGPTGPGFYRVWLVLDGEGDGGRSLVLTRQALSAGQVGGFERTVLARNVAAFRLAYFGRTDQTKRPAWQENWDGMRWPPDLVRVTLRLDGEAPGAWPETVIRLWAAEHGL